MEIIFRLDAAADSRRLTRGELDLRKLLKRKLLGLCSLQRTIAWQRSRLLFLREGDANTEFFHRHARHRQRRSVITTLTKDGETYTGQDNLARMVDQYYGGLLGAAPEREHAMNLDILNLPSLDLSHLELPFTEGEVEKIVKAMPLDKAPGPDGFTGRFYASCWDIIKHDFMRALHLFYHGDMRGLPAINKDLISLLPKVDGAVDIRDFRPVSLVHGAINFF